MIDFSKIKNNKQVVGGSILGLVFFLTVIGKNLKFAELNGWQTFTLLLFLIGFIFVIILKTLPLLNEKTSKTEEKEEKESATGSRIPNILSWILPLAALLLILFMDTSYNTTIIYEEKFNTNNYPDNWVEGEQEEATAKIDKGFFSLKVIGDVPISRRIDIHKYFAYSLISDTANFEIELSLKKSEGLLGKNDGYGLELVGNTKNSRYYSFFINDNQEYAIQIYEFSSPVRDVVTWKTEKSIKTGNFNTLKVRCIQQKFYFFINGKEVENNIELASFGNEVGFGTAERTAIQVDYLKFSTVN